METDFLWLAVGFVGQSLFFGRFLIQWIVSERRKQSTVPPAFWWMSLGGGLIVLAYAIFRRDPVFIIGNLFGVVVYCRNLWFVYRGSAAG